MGLAIVRPRNQQQSVLQWLVHCTVEKRLEADGVRQWVFAKSTVVESERRLPSADISQ